MTSDAKIGLLLGLVFIFIIAFIINGLPNFKSEADNNELTTTMVSLQNKQLGIGSGVSDSEVLERPRLLERTVLVQQPVVDMPMLEQPSVIDQTINVPPATNESETIRYSTALPGSIIGESNSNIIETPAPTKTIEIVAPAEQQVLVTKEVPSVEENSLRQISSDVVAKVEKPKAAVPQVREYVVQEGDSLGSISKKVYGEELGNKKVNIDKIFAANNKTLKSPDAIYIGQKLIIPAPEGSASVQVSQEDKPLGSSMLERVKQIGRSGFSSTKEEPKKVVLTKVEPAKVEPAKVAGKKYVVKEGDNLWKIAHTELGDGSRFEEIAKMNKDVLKSKDSIVVGMTLVLPNK